MHQSSLRHSLPLTLAAALTLGTALPGFAQLAPEANPGYVLPSMNDSISQPSGFNDPLDREQETPTLSVPDQPSIVQVDQASFRVNAIQVSGNAILSDEEIRQITAPYEGRNLTPDDLAQLVAGINEQYRVRGYLTSLAFIPPQDLDRGVITVKVLEGLIGDMELTGNKHFKAKVIERRISSLHEPGKPLNIPELEKELLRINRQEPFRLKATLSPGEETGETNIRLQVQEQQPFQIGLIMDNMGRPTIGTYRFGGELIDRNVTGRGDRANLRYLVGAGQHIASASYTLPIGSRGTELSGMFGFSHVDVDLTHLDGLRDGHPSIVGNAYNYGLLLSHPLDVERTWVADIGLNARRISNFYDGEKYRSDDIRSATLGLNFNKYDRYGRSFARAQASFAPEWLGANTSFFKTEAFATRVTRLPRKNLLILRAYSQWTPSDLPPVEQIQIGGVNSVRGYTEGLMVGDRGFFASAEWRWPIPMLGKVSPWLGERVQGAVFFDYGQVWMDKGSRYYNVWNGKGRNTLMGTGVGLRAHLTDYLQGYVDMAFGLKDQKDIEPYAQPTARVHFGVRSELLPNDYKARSDEVTPIKTDVFRPRSVGAIEVEDLQTEVSDPTLEPMDHLMNPFRVY